MAITSVDPFKGSFMPRKERGRKRRLLGRIAYLLGVGLVVSYVIFFPPWVGNLYMPAYDGSEGYQWGGTFGLRDDEMKSPIWDRPHAHSPDIHATVRWPWQAPSSRAHVELSTFGIAWRIATGMVLLGLGLRIWNGITAGNRSDHFVDLAWSVSLGTAISILGLVVYGGFTAGYGLTDAVVVGGLSSGALLGLAFGAMTFRATRKRRSLLTVTQLAWFVLGLIGSIAILFVMGSLASGFRGNPIGVTELGTSAFVGGQTVINVVTGFGIATAGWLMSRILTWLRMPRGLGLGMLAGSLMWGVIFAFWH